MPAIPFGQGILQQAAQIPQVVNVKLKAALGATDHQKSEVKKDLHSSSNKQCFSGQVSIFWCRHLFFKQQR
jgi:hypothetical protein